MNSKCTLMTFSTSPAPSMVSVSVCSPCPPRYFSVRPDPAPFALCSAPGVLPPQLCLLPHDGRGLSPSGRWLVQGGSDPSVGLVRVAPWTSVPLACTCNWSCLLWEDVPVRQHGVAVHQQTRRGKEGLHVGQHPWEWCGKGQGAGCALLL